MKQVKITVLRTLFHADLAEAYRRPDIHSGPCPYFEAGDEFLVKYIGDKPEGFGCDWAWNDLQELLLAAQLGGRFSPWMQDDKTFIACCTDGIKPVIFRLEQLDD